MSQLPRVGNKLPLAFDDLGDQQVKNIPQAIRVYRVQAETLAAKPIAVWLPKIVSGLAQMPRWVILASGCLTS